jgi:hypothetical protein
MPVFTVNHQYVEINLTLLFWVCVFKYIVLYFVIFVVIEWKYLYLFICITLIYLIWLVKFEVRLMMLLKTCIFWYMTLCYLVSSACGFEGS